MGRFQTDSGAEENRSPGEDNRPGHGVERKVLDMCSWKQITTEIG